MAKSVITLKIEVARYATAELMQRPGVSGLQIFLRGLHWAIASTVETEYIAKQLQINICTETYRDMFPFLLGTKMRRYWRRIDSLTKKTTGQ